MLLIVKGNKFEAANHASARGIPFAFIKEVNSKGTLMTLGEVSIEFDHIIRQWFQEDTENMRFPRYTAFPTGSLLWFL